MAIMTRDFNSVDMTDPKAAALAVKRAALEMGADVVGIGNIERWANAPLQMDPKQIMPECKRSSVWSSAWNAAVCAALRKEPFSATTPPWDTADLPIFICR